MSERSGAGVRAIELKYMRRSGKRGSAAQLTGSFK